MKIDIDKIKMDSSWKRILSEEFEKPYFLEIKIKYLEALKSGAKIFPPSDLIFNAFLKTPFDKVKAVIIGQDPYHGEGQAMGLCFSVPSGIKVPASLRNIYKELERSYGYTPPNHGDLSAWTTEGVFMLNAVLSVEEGKAGSHKHFGWQRFTDAVIAKISREKENVVFLLWGNFAKEKKALIDTSKHLVLESPHPSPLAGGGFIGNNHFVETNKFLQAKGIDTINWKI